MSGRCCPSGTGRAESSLVAKMSLRGVWSIRYPAPTYMVLMIRSAAAAGTAACAHTGFFLFFLYLLFFISMPPSASVLPLPVSAVWLMLLYFAFCGFPSMIALRIPSFTVTFDIRSSTLSLKFIHNTSHTSRGSFFSSCSLPRFSNVNTVLGCRPMILAISGTGSS